MDDFRLEDKFFLGKGPTRSARFGPIVIGPKREKCSPVPRLANRDTRVFMADLKTVYQAETIDKAERALGRLEQKWGAKYPKVIESWRRNWSNLSLFFGYSKMIRKVMYTTNAIEAFHRQLRRVTKTKGSFTSDSALMKLLFLVQRDVTAKWQKPMHNWNRILAELAILYDERLKLDL